MPLQDQEQPLQALTKLQLQEQLTSCRDLWVWYRSGEQ
jgi:hypothetical protein